MTVLSFQPDAQGRNSYAPHPSTVLYNATLTIGSETNITVPSVYNSYIACFAYKPGAVVWVDLSGAAASAPVSGNLTACTVELNPGQRVVQAGGKISMITADTTDAVGVALYGIP